MKSLSFVQLFETLWTVAYQAPPFMDFSRQEYWSELPFPTLGDLPDPGIKPVSPALAGSFLTTAPPGKPMRWLLLQKKKKILSFGEDIEKLKPCPLLVGM